MGIEAYNNECRNIVMRYAGEWEVGGEGSWTRAYFEITVELN